MDPKTGELYQVESEDEASMRGLIPIPPEDVDRIRRMTLEQRVDWAKTREILTTHPLGGIDDPDERRKVRNALKAERRERRGR